MISGLTLTIGSIFFMLLLLIVYFSQNNNKTMETKLYKYMLITMMFLLLTEVVSSTVIYYLKDYSLKELAIRIHWLTGIFCYYFLYLYNITFVSDISVNSLKEYIFYNTRTKLVTAFTVVATIIYFFVPFDSLDIVSYIPGPAAYYIIGYASIMVILIIGYTIIHGKGVSSRKKQAIYTQAILIIVVVLLQLLFKEIAFEAVGTSLQMFFLYFNIENPDIRNVQELEGIKEEIDKSNKTKTDFLSNMSNEIVHPMNTIIKCSKLILKEKSYSEIETRDYIKEISIAGGNLLNIIDNILDISALESNNEILEEKEYSLVNIIKDLVNIVNTKIGEKPVEFILNVDEKIPTRLYGDHNKLYQILLNFLTNAIEYTEVGKIKLTITSEITNEDCLLTMKVSDTGCGIKEEEQAKINSIFSKNNTSSKNVDSSNFGLTIVKKYADMMSGKVSMESEYGAGSIFQIVVKQKIINSMPIGNITDAIKSKKDIDYIDCSQYTILIVDDDELSVKVTKRILEPYKFNIKTLTSGRDCIHSIKAENKYDMIFMDHMMREMDGIETLHKLKKLDGYVIPPVVVLTANAISGMREMYLNEGFDEYLSKPIKPYELSSLIKKYFSDKKDI